MPNIVRGKPFDVSDSRVGIVVAQYNESITSKLLEGAVQTLLSSGIEDLNIDVAWVPGAWEIPLIADQMATSSDEDNGKNQ